jgi:hypothetical protein
MDMSDHDMKKVHMITDAVMEQLITDYGFSPSSALAKLTKNVEKLENKTGGAIHHLKKRGGEIGRIISGTTLDALHKKENKLGDSIDALEEKISKRPNNHILKSEYAKQIAELTKTQNQIKAEEHRVANSKGRQASNVFDKPERTKSSRSTRSNIHSIRENTQDEYEEPEMSDPEGGDGEPVYQDPHARPHPSSRHGRASSTPDHRDGRYNPSNKRFSSLSRYEDGTQMHAY